MIRELESGDLFFDKETDNYRIVAWAPEGGHPTFSIQSKASGLVIPNVNIEYLFQEAVEFSGRPREYHSGGESLVNSTRETLSAIQEEDSIEKLDGYISSLLPLHEVSRELGAGSEMWDAIKINSNILPEATVTRAMKFSQANQLQKRIQDLTSHSGKSYYLSNGYHRSDVSFMKALLRNVYTGKAGIMHEDTPGEYVEALADIVSYAMTRESINIDDDLHRLAGCLDSSNLVKDLDVSHPYHSALQEMVLGEDYDIDESLISQTGLFGGENAKSDDIMSIWLSKFSFAAAKYQVAAKHSRKSSVIHQLSKIKAGDQKRNFLQYFSLVGGAPSVFSGAGCLSDTVKYPSGLKQPPREVFLRALAPDMGSMVLEGEKKKMGKKELGVILHNIKALDDLARTYGSHELHTLEGSKLVIDNTMNELARFEEKMVSISYTNKNGDLTISERVPMEPFTQGMANKAQIIAHIPQDILTTNAHLQSLNLIGENKVLEGNILEGIVRHRSGIDKKNTAMVNTWKGMVGSINKAVENVSNFDNLSPEKRSYHISRGCDAYSKPTLLKDYERIVGKLEEGVAAKLLYQEGAISPMYDDLDDYQENMDSSDSTVIVQDDEISSGPIAVELSSTPSGYEGYAKLLKLSHQAHTGYSKLSREISPETKISWEKCAPDFIFEFEGETYVIEHLDSYSKVVQHGLAMDHCVGSYATMCMRGEYAAFAVRCEGEDVATIGMHFDGDEFEFDQMYGPSNRTLDDDFSKEIHSVFIDDLEEECEINGKEVDLAIAESQEVSECELLSLQFGIDMSSKEATDKAIDFLLKLKSPESVYRSLQSVMWPIYHKLNEIAEENMAEFLFHNEEDEEYHEEDSPMIYQELSRVRENIESVVRDRAGLGPDDPTISF